LILNEYLPMQVTFDPNSNSNPLWQMHVSTRFLGTQSACSLHWLSSHGTIAVIEYIACTSVSSTFESRDGLWRLYLLKYCTLVR